MIARVELVTLFCRRCGHRWTPRSAVVSMCPKCKSLKWEEPKTTAEK